MNDCQNDMIVRVIKHTIFYGRLQPSQTQGFKATVKSERICAFIMIISKPVIAETLYCAIFKESTMITKLGDLCINYLMM